MCNMTKRVTILPFPNAKTAFSDLSTWESVYKRLVLAGQKCHLSVDGRPKRSEKDATSNVSGCSLFFSCDVFSAKKNN